MEPADGVASDVVTTRRDHRRGALIGVGTAIAAGLIVLLAPAPAHADDGDPDAAVGGLVSEITGAVDALVDRVVTPVVQPVLEPLPTVRDVPLVGRVVGSVVDAEPVRDVTQPVAGLVDGLVGETVGSLPIVDRLLGDTPVGSILTPLAGTVDGTLDDVLRVAGADPITVPAASTPDLAAATISATRDTQRMLRHVTAPLGAIVELGDRAGAALGAVTGGSSPASGGAAVAASVLSSGSTTTSLALAVFGGGLIALLFAGRVRPQAFRAPPSPTFDTDSSPD